MLTYMKYAGTTAQVLPVQFFRTTDRDGFVFLVSFEPNILAWCVQYQTSNGDIIEEWINQSGPITHYTY